MQPGKQSDSVNALFREELRLLYSVERQITKASPLILKEIGTLELSQAVTHHVAETEEHIARVEQIATLFGGKASGRTCQAMESLLHEALVGIKQLKEVDPLLRDLAICNNGRRIEHYEIASYQSLHAMAQSLDRTDVVELIVATLQQEQNADYQLREIAESKLLPECPVEEELLPPAPN